MELYFGETDNNEIITLPLDTYLNKNIAVFGSSGSKKSRGFAIPNGIELVQEELQSKMDRDTSLVFTDPKGELYRKLAKYLESKGYNVKVFNLVNPTYSHGAKFINFVEDETDAQIFSQIVIEGTQLDSRSGGDEFWSRGEQNLLKALLLYVINYAKENDKNLGFMYDTLASGNIKKIDRLFSETEGPTRLSYNIYAQATDIVKQSIVTGLATRLQIFQTDKIRNITNKDEINFEKIGNEKTCIFVVTSDTNSAFDFLSTLFFSFLFIKLIKQADENQSGRLKVETSLILDEFTNIGRIVDFEKKLATTRSRGINIFMIFQNIAQLKNRYDNDVWQEILGNADTKICMGAGDIMTAEYLTKYLGVATVSTNAIRKEAGFDGKFTYGMENVSTNKRNLMNPDELLKLDNNKEIVIVRGRKPFICNKYDYSKHIEVEKLEDVTLEDQKEKFKDNVENEKNKKQNKKVKYSFKDF
ncbi:MAG: type IV secretory system conjugative DNA transfer family protein [Clostridia bacterium]|nr:type IV secretory system conjugative DNA transfer family protein [Clostridia bacterium]